MADVEKESKTNAAVEIDSTSQDSHIKWTTTRIELWSFYLYYVVCPG